MEEKEAEDDLVVETERDTLTVVSSSPSSLQEEEEQEEPAINEAWSRSAAAAAGERLRRHATVAQQSQLERHHATTLVVEGSRRPSASFNRLSGTTVVRPGRLTRHDEDALLSHRRRRMVSPSHLTLPSLSRSTEDGDHHDSNPHDQSPTSTTTPPESTRHVPTPTRAAWHPRDVALLSRTVRSMARLAALHETKRYDTTQPMLQELGLMERWTDEADSLREPLVAAHGIPILLNVVRVFGSHAPVLVKVCNIITYLARNGTCLRALSIQPTIESVLTAMGRHGHHSLLQARACNALNNLAMRAENRIRIAQIQGIPLILRGMEKHAKNPEVQANGCNCLWNLSIWPPNRPLIAHAKGVVRILQAMKDHIQDPALFGEGCGALWNLADHPPTRLEILRGGGIATICQAMELHGHHSFVMNRLCCGALESLLNDDDWGRVLLWKQQEPSGIGLVLSAMRNRPGDEELQSAGCGILAHFAMGDLMQLAIHSFVDTVISQGAVHVLLTALQSHPTSVKVQGRACSAIGVLSYHGLARHDLVQAGAVRIVEQTLLEDHHATDRVVFGTAVLALSQLTTPTTTTTLSGTNTNDNNNYQSWQHCHHQAPAA